MDDIKFMTGLHVEPVVASERPSARRSTQYFGKNGVERRRPTAKAAATWPIEALEELGTTAGRQPRGRRRRRRKSTPRRSSGRAARRPIIKLVNALMLSAIQKGASDIHIEPYEKDMRIRFRIDGAAARR